LESWVSELRRGDADAALIIASDPAANFPRAAIEHFAEQQRVERDTVLQEVAVDFEAKTMVERAVRIGSPAGEILKSAERADLVVVGARGLGPIDRLLVGSVSERVLHHAGCAVLVVKGRER